MSRIVLKNLPWDDLRRRVIAESITLEPKAREVLSRYESRDDSQPRNEEWVRTFRNCLKISQLFKTTDSRSSKADLLRFHRLLRFVHTFMDTTLRYLESGYI